MNRPFQQLGTILTSDAGIVLIAVAAMRTRGSHGRHGPLPSLPDPREAMKDAPLTPTHVHRPGRRRIAAAGLLLLAWASTQLCVTEVHAQPLTINGQYKVGGPSYAIGTLPASVTNPNNEAATFTLNAPYRNLMSDAAGTQFRFFQVITYDDEPEIWDDKIITPAGTANHTGDVVDVPSGGWDYESKDGGGGDDTSPFYESETRNNPTTGIPYKFPDLSYPDLHSPDGVNPGTMQTSDSPGLMNPNHKTLFETFIAYEDPTRLSIDQTIDILGGYTWGVQRDATGTITAIAPTYVPYSDINVATLQELKGALDRSGFGDWSIEANDVILAVPEQSGLIMGSIAVLIAAASHRWRQKRRRRRGHPRTPAGAGSNPV